jgi:hypothetical protein
MANDQS